MDFTLFHDLDAAGLHWVDDPSAWLATYLPAIIALLFPIPWARRRHAPRDGAVMGTIAAAPTHPHARPLIDRAHDPSFASDHATGAFAIAIAVFERVAARLPTGGTLGRLAGRAAAEPTRDPRDLAVAPETGDAIVTWLLARLPPKPSSAG